MSLNHNFIPVWCIGGHIFLFLMLFCSNLTDFPWFQLVYDGPTDGPTDVPKDQQRDTPSYRDVRTHLKIVTSRTEFRQQMRSGKLPMNLSLNSLLNGILSYSWCYFVQIWPISQKFNSYVMDRPTDRPTEQLTDGHTLLQRCENASKFVAVGGYWTLKKRAMISTDDALWARREKNTE